MFYYDSVSLPLLLLYRVVGEKADVDVNELLAQEDTYSRRVLLFDLIAKYNLVEEGFKLIEQQVDHAENLTNSQDLQHLVLSTSNF